WQSAGLGLGSRQRQRWRHRARPSARRDGRAAGRHAAARAEGQRQAARDRWPVPRRRWRRCHGLRAGLMALSVTRPAYAGPYDLTEEQDLFRRTLREFVEREIVPIASELDETETYPRQSQAKMGELGLMGLLVPEE